jgi:hypothetical protein
MKRAVSGASSASSARDHSHQLDTRRHAPSARAKERTCITGSRSFAVERGTEAGTA